ncbi:PilZ domain-containing protein [Bdellovibrionales bacterium]|nr:PilZ domain-containing protein [Bdellovibrionales bacterium]
MSSEACRRVRSAVETKVMWVIDGTEYVGHSLDLSLNGISIATDDRPAVDTNLELFIYLPGSQITPPIDVQATVVRIDENGFAASFNELDFESYSHLKNLVAYQNEEPDKVLTEQEERPGIK